LSGPTRKRFWDAVQVEDTPAGAGPGFTVRLDQQPVRLSNGAALRFTSRPLAEAVAAEWARAGDAKGGLFAPDDLVLTGLAGTMQEHVVPRPGDAADRLMGFAHGELLCFRAAHPAALSVLQDEAWQPWLDWLHATYGIRLLVGQGVMPLSQPEDALAALRELVGTRSPAVLTGLGVIVPALGSLVLGLALAAARLDAAEAFRLGRLDEDFQASRWGVDREAETRALRLHVEIAIAVRFMRLCDG